MRFDGADQLTAAALRPQPGVDLEEGRRGHPQHLARQPGGECVGALTDEDDVDVADVVQFAGTAFAHRDDRQPGRRAVTAHVGLGHPQRGGQRGVRQVRQLGAHHDERQHRFVLHRRGHVEPGQYQELVAVQGLQARHHRTGISRRLVDTLGERRTQFVARGQFCLAAQQFPRLGVDSQVIPQGQRRAEHGEQPSAQRAFGEQRGVQLVPVGVGVLRQPDQGAQRGVGIGCARQRPQQVDVGLVVVVVPTQLRQAIARRRIDQAEPAHAGQPGALRRGFGHDHDGIASRLPCRARRAPC